VLSDELVQAPFSEQPVSVLVEVAAVGGAGRFAVEEHAEGNRLGRSVRQHEMGVVGAEPVSDAPAGLVERDVLTPDRPFAGEGPVVELQWLGDLVGVSLVERVATRRRETFGALVA